MVASPLSSASFLPKRKYICAKLSQESSQRLDQWLSDQGIERTLNYNGLPLLGPFDFHITLFHSVNRVVLGNSDQLLDASRFSDGIKVTPVDFQMLGYEGDIPVLIVEPSILETIRSTIQQMTGIYDAWDEWKPHISLSYDKNVAELPSELPTFDLVCDRLVISDIEEKIETIGSNTEAEVAYESMVYSATSATDSLFEAYDDGKGIILKVDGEFKKTFNTLNEAKFFIKTEQMQAQRQLARKETIKSLLKRS